MKKLKLNRETISILASAELEHARGGGLIAGTIIVRTTVCPVLTNGCTGGGCVETIGTGTSVINPSGG